MTVRARCTALLAAVFAVAGLTVVPGNASATVPTTALGGFESAASVRSVTVTSPDADRVRWASGVHSDGARSLEYDVGGATGPAGSSATQIVLHAGSTFSSVSWAGHLIISWDVMSNSPVQLLGQATIKDTLGHSYNHGYFIPAFGYHAFDAYVADVAAAGVDITHISEIDLTLPRPAEPLQVYVDTMRLVDAWPYDHSGYEAAATPGVIGLMRLPALITRQQVAVRAVEARIPRTDSAADVALRTQATGLSTALGALANQSGEPGLDLAAAQAIRQQVEAIGGAVDRLDVVVAARRADPRNTDFGVTTADSMSLVYPLDRGCHCTTAPGPLGLARGEYQSEQLVLIPYAAELAGATVSIAAVNGPNGSAGVDATVSPIGFLDVTPTDAYKNTNDRTSWYSGWTADPIRTDIHSVDVPAGRFQPYWVTVHAAPDAAAGRYRINLQINATGRQPTAYSLTADVWPVTVPDRPDLTTAFEFEPTIIPQLYGLTDPTEVTAKLRQYEDFLETYKMEPGNIYASTPPTVDELEYLKNKWGLRHFNVLYLNGTLFDVNDPSSWQAQIDAWMATITRAMGEYQKAGLDKDAYVYGFDEAGPQYLPIIKKTLATIKAKFPDLPVMSTLRDNTMGPGSGLTGLIDIWAPQMDLYRSSSAAGAHARGDQVYWYPDIATGHPYPNWFNGYPPIDTRQMVGPMSHRAGVDGVLYYKVDRWINHPLLDDGIYSSWNPATFDTTAGDGSMFYPGADGPLPSIRLANFRDGMQDYNLLDLLAAAIQHPPAGTPPAELAHAKALLAAGDVVQGDASYTEDPGQYRQWRAAVAAEIGTLHG